MVTTAQNQHTTYKYNGTPLTGEKILIDELFALQTDVLLDIELKDRKGHVILAYLSLRSCFKTPQLARYGVINRFKMLIYSHVNCAFSPIYALSRTHLRNFTTAS